MIKESVDLLDTADVEKLLELINRECTSDTKSQKKLFALAVSIVKRLYRFRFLGPEKDLLPSVIVSLTRYLMQEDRGNITLDFIKNFVNKELVSVQVKSGWYEEYLSAEPVYTGFSPYDLAAFKIAVENVRKVVPTRLVPLVQLYLDTGICYDKTLNLLDRYYLNYLISTLGGKSVDVDVSSIKDLIPKTVTERLLFLAILSDEYPIAFVLLTQTKSLENLLMTLEVVNGEGGFPSLLEFLSILEKISKVSDLTLGERENLFKDKTMLAVFLSSVDFEVSSSSNLYFEKLSKIMDRESDTYVDNLENISRKSRVDPSLATRFFSELNRESNCRIRLLNELRKK